MARQRVSGVSGAGRVVWGASWAFVQDWGAGRLVPSSRRRVLTNASARSRVAPSAGL